jgi:hypothetical protein
MQGISGQLVKTIGSTWLTLKIGNQNRKFEFQVVPSFFPTLQDGIVGKPFLQGNSQYAVINLGKNEITLSDKTEMILLARSETIIPVTVDNIELETQEILIYAQNISENVSFGNVLNIVKNQQILKVIERLIINNNRRKRGLINLVDRAANVLFGVCDDNDSKYFYSRIKELRESKLQTTQILESQIRILKSVISNVNYSLIQEENDKEILVDKYNILLYEVIAEKVEIVF